MAATLRWTREVARAGALLGRRAARVVRLSPAIAGSPVIGCTNGRAALRRGLRQKLRRVFLQKFRRVLLQKLWRALLRGRVLLSYGRLFARRSGVAVVCGKNIQVEVTAVFDAEVLRAVVAAFCASIVTPETCAEHAVYEADDIQT